MVITEIVPGVDTGFSTKLNSNFKSVFKHYGSDQTAASTTSNLETSVGSVTITAGEVTNGILVIASGKSESKNTGDDSVIYYGTIKLRAGESATPTSNTLYKTITRDTGTTGTGYFQFTKHSHGWTLVFFISDLDWSNTNYVQITGTNTIDAQTAVTCESIEVLGL